MRGSDHAWKNSLRCFKRRCSKGGLWVEYGSRQGRNCFLTLGFLQEFLKGAAPALVIRGNFMLRTVLFGCLLNFNRAFLACWILVLGVWGLAHVGLWNL